MKGLAVGLTLALACLLAAPMVVWSVTGDTLYDMSNSWHRDDGYDLNGDGETRHEDLFLLSQDWEFNFPTPTPTPTPGPPTRLRMTVCDADVSAGDTVVLFVDQVDPLGRNVNPGTNGGGPERSVTVSVSGSALVNGFLPSTDVPIDRPEGARFTVTDEVAEMVTVLVTAPGLAGDVIATLNFRPLPGKGKPAGDVAPAGKGIRVVPITALAPVRYERLNQPPKFAWTVPPGTPPLTYGVAVQDRCLEILWVANGIRGTTATYDGPELDPSQIYLWNVFGISADGRTEAALEPQSATPARFLVE